MQAHLRQKERPIVTTLTPRRIIQRVVALIAVALVLLAVLAACDSPADTTFTLATVLPASGPDATVGQAMQRAVDLAVKQNADLGSGYHLTVAQTDENDGGLSASLAGIAANAQVVGIVGPLASDSAVAMLPVIEQHGITTITPGAMLPGLTRSDAAATEGLSFTTLHPIGKPVAFFRVPETDAAAGLAAADLALAPAKSHGLAANAVFTVDDGSSSGQALVAAFAQELKAHHGSIAGQQSIDAGDPESVQSIVSAIVEAQPDLVFFGGGTAAAASLRATLSLTGAPQLPLLAVGSVAANPGWSAAVGVVPAAAFTTALASGPDPASLAAGAKSFVAAYQAAYPGQA
ncbi:MAG: ABC transporter substrate-binding protein, partial [Ktedonobacterales bacterium]